MQQRIVVNKGKKYIVNCVGWEDMGIGPGFAVGQLTLKSYTDLYWYIVSASGSVGTASVYVSQSVLTAFGTSSYYDQNYPYQLLYSTDGNTYQVYLSGSAPNATVMVSQSMWATGSYIRNWQNAIIDTAKPYLYLQSITDGNFYTFYLSSSEGTTYLVSDQGVPPIPSDNYRITEAGDIRIIEDGSFRVVE